MTLPAKPTRPVPAGRIKAMIDGMAGRQAAMMKRGAAQPPADLPFSLTSDSEWFRVEFAVAAVDPSNVTLRVDGDQLVVKIGLGGGVETIDGATRRIEASARFWERSFALRFKPNLAATRVTVSAASVVVEAARLR